MPWGYDEAHTDQDGPYTVEQLAHRDVAPHRYAYPSTEAYLQGWELWRRLRSDGRLSAAERDVADRIRYARIAGKMAGQLGVPVSEVTAWMSGLGLPVQP